MIITPLLFQTVICNELIFFLEGEDKIKLFWVILASRELEACGKHLLECLNSACASCGRHFLATLLSTIYVILGADRREESL